MAGNFHQAGDTDNFSDIMVSIIRSQSLGQGPLARYPFAQACIGLGPEWLGLLEGPAASLDPAYLARLEVSDWLPGPDLMLAALRHLPLAEVNAVLVGESPYPRKGSAIGEAFHDGLVGTLWSGQGLAKPVNKATSLRNLVKMMLVAEGLVSPAAKAEEIAALERSGLVDSLADVFAALRRHGVLCINATPVLADKNKAREAATWHRFTAGLLNGIHRARPEARFLLFGAFAKQFAEIEGAQAWPKLMAEHPYNVSFINDPAVLDYFRPLRLLRR